MNTTIPVRQVGLAGQIKDITNSDIPLQGVRSARSCRIEDQALRSYSDAEVYLDSVAGQTYLFSHPYWRITGEGWIVVSKVTAPSSIKVEFVTPAGGRTDISPISTLDVNAKEWYAVQLGEWFILTNNGAIDNPQWTDTALTQLVDMAGWPTNYKCSVIEVYKNFLFAVGITKTGAAAAEESRMVKWSHPYAAGDTTTYWDYTDPTILAGETLLAEPGRALTALQPYRDSLMVFFDRRTWRADYVGGQFVFNFQQVFSDDGCVGPQSHVATQDGAIVFGHRDIYIHDGSTKRSLTDLRMTRYIYDSADLSFSPVGAWHPKRNEIMFLCRTYTSGEANLFFIANTIHDYAWTEVISELNGNGVLTHISVGPRPASGSITYGDWTTEVYNAFNDATYSSLSGQDETVTLMGTSVSQNVIWNMDYAGATAPVTIFRRDALIEHRGIDLDELGMGANKIIYLNRILPQMIGAGVVKFTLGTHATPGGSITWKPPVTYDLDDATDYAVDIRAAGRYLAYRLEPNDPLNPALFSLAGMDLEVSTPRGKR
tara:strand:+ start:607 stop:2235 length:1629 start_codon:yes stop_codon:yes gene_type:complete